jgi:sortase A
MTSTTAPARPASDRAAGDGWRMVARGVGQLLITCGVVILLFVAYELWFTGFYTQQQQDKIDHQLQQQWRGTGPDVSTLSPDKVKLGSGIAVLYIPRFGRHYHFVVVEGTGFTDLQKGPGHYTGTALPGQVGNFYVAGHRTTYLHPFNKIATLRNHDVIVLETKTMWFTYTIENIPGTNIPWREIVDPTDVAAAIYPVPDQPDPNKKPTLKLLTFSSCHPEYSARQRYVIHAMLTDTLPKGPGVFPPVLTQPAGR